MKSLTHTKKWLIALTLLAALPAAGYAINDAASGFRLANAGMQTIDAHGTCQKITNNSGKEFFIPTKTASEWQSFRQAASTRLTGIALENCCTAQASSQCVSGNVYWFDSCGTQGALKQNCNGNGCRDGACGSDLPPPPPAPSSPF